jgi:tetratricopeptide (TPR) repeat protein
MPDFAVDDRNAAVVAELCRRLDGLPLAIELVAARVKLLPPAELLRRLHGPWLLSADGLRDVSARQKTLRGAISWSYDLLTPIEQTLFVRLAVFVGGCTLEAAELLCGDTLSPTFPLSLSPLQVLDGIASLLDKSLLHRQAGPNGETRYALFETVREFALEQLAAIGEVAAAQNRHLAWCWTVVASAVPSPFVILEQASWKQIDAEIHNLRAGLEWALQSSNSSALRLVLATSRYLANRGLVREARTWIDRTLAMPEAAAATADRAALLYCKGIAEFLADESVASEVSVSESLALSSHLNLILGQAGAHYYLGRLASMAGDAERAEMHLEVAAAAFLEANDIIDWGHVISILAEIVMFRGDLQRSRALHTQAVTRNLAPEQRHHVFWSVGGLADLALVEGDYASAQRLAEECLALCRHRNNPGETAWPLTCLGEIATRRGDFAAARAYLDEALTLGRKADSYWRGAIVRADLGDLAVVDDRPGEALQFYRDSLPILLQRGIFAHPQGSLRLACLASALDQHEVAATLLAACSAAVERGVEVLFPITQADFERALAASQTALDADTFEGAWATGRSLSPHAAVARGLQAIHVSE